MGKICLKLFQRPGGDADQKKTSIFSSGCILFSAQFTAVEGLCEIILNLCLFSVAY